MANPEKLPVGPGTCRGGGLVGRTAGLSRAAAGVETDSRGFVKVDEYMRTSASDIFGAGDVTGRMMLVPPAIQQGFVAATNAVCGPTMPIQERVNTTASFTCPEYGQTGLTEEKAGETHDIVTKVIRFRLDYAHDYRRAKFGFCKLITDCKTHRILGCQALDRHVTSENALQLPLSASWASRS